MSDLSLSDISGSSVYPGSPRVGVGALVIHQNSLLLVQRAKPPYQGEWTLPGGSLELGETLPQAVAREVFEETGLTVLPKKLVFHFDVIEKDEGGRFRFHYVILDFLAEYVSGTLKAASDVRDAQWVAFGSLRTFPVHPLALQALRQSEVWSG